MQNHLNSEFGIRNAELKNSSNAISISMIYSHSKTLTQFQATASHWRKLDPRLLFAFKVCYVIFLQKCIIYILYRQIRNPLSLKLDDLMNWGEAPDLKFLEKILT